MSRIDQERIAAVRTLQLLGYTYQGGEHWTPPITLVRSPLVQRITKLEAALRQLVYPEQDPVTGRTVWFAGYQDDDVTEIVGDLLDDRRR